MLKTQLMGKRWIAFFAFSHVLSWGASWLQTIIIIREVRRVAKWLKA